MKEKIYVGRTLAEIEELAVKELGVAKDNMYFDLLTDQEITRDEIQVHVMVDANPVKLAKDYIENFLHESNIYGFVERRMRDNVVEFGISTENENALLIGRNSKTLIALQYVVNNMVNQFFDLSKESGLIIKIDIGDYRRRRDENLERLATKIAKDVIRSRMPIKLRPMNSYERKVIHNKLTEWRDVTTHSEGVEPNRCLIVSPKKTDNRQVVEKKESETEPKEVKKSHRNHHRKPRNNKKTSTPSEVTSNQTE